MIIDSHVHIWDAQAAQAQWLASERTASIRRAFDLDDYVAGTRDIVPDSAIVVTATETIGETMRVVEACGGSIVAAGIVGWLDVRRPVDEFLANQLIGVRQSLLNGDAAWLDEADVRAGLGRLERADLAFEVLTSAEGLPAVIRCAAAMPELTLVVDHLGNPPSDPDGWTAWSRAVRHLGALPNVRVKLSGDRVTARSAAAVLDTLGAARVMIGSDWPVSLLRNSLDAELASLTRLLGGLSTTERDQVLGATAVAAYGLSA